MGRPAGRLADYEQAVHTYLGGESGPADWEPRQEAERRIRREIAAILDERPGESIAVVSHGTVLALYGCALLEVADSFELWRAIPFAAFARVDPGRGVLLEAFRAGDPAPG